MNFWSRFHSLVSAALLLALPLAREVQAQVTSPAPTTVVTAGPDSTQVSTQLVPDSVRRTARLFGLKMTGPTKAGLLSALLPGAGQVYNRSWWKIPLAVGGVGGTIYGELYYQNLYKVHVKAKGIRNDGEVGTVDNNELTRDLTDNQIQVRINFYRRQRDSFLAYIGVAYGLQILDAVVDAHLRDFDISEDLSLRWEPTILQMPMAAATPGLGLTFTLK